jgi:hypothetical protein
MTPDAPQEDEGQKCPACHKPTAQYDPRARAWVCPCGWQDRR